jgi:MraZ protein
VRRVFTGEYRHTVDEKGRLAIPARFRAQLEGGAVLSRWIDGCLAIHTRAGWAALAEKVAAVPVTDPAGRLFERQIFGGALEAEIDRQGRVLVPGYLRDEVGIAGDALVIGVRDHGEIWAPHRWAVYRRSMDDPTTFAEAIRGLGI